MSKSWSSKDVQHFYAASSGGFLVQHAEIDLDTSLAKGKWLTNLASLPKKKGCYVLLLQLLEDKPINIGKSKNVVCPAGLYFYVGSAMGVGGLASRVGRHFRNEDTKPLRWHIDFLRAHMTLIGCWVWVTEQKIECQLARALHRQTDLKPLMRIGSSDCRCPTHVYFTEVSGDI